MPMRRDVAAKRYAQAILDIAQGQGDITRWLDEVKAIADLMTHPDVAALLENRRVPRQVKYRIIDTALPDSNPLAVNFAKLLVDKGRTALAGQIWEEFQELVWQRQGIAHARVTTAISLTQEESQAISKRLEEMTSQKVIMDTEVDPAILGGLVVRIGDRLIDGSTRSRLQALKRTLQDSAR